jgi:predicted GNAT family N-acyltransferase
MSRVKGGKKTCLLLIDQLRHGTDFTEILRLQHCPRTASCVKRLQNAEKRSDEQNMYSISIADNRTDLEAVLRFWYEIYCVQREVLVEEADHASKMLDDPFLSTSNLFVAADENGICGTVLTTYSNQSDIKKYADFYEMSRVPEHPRTTSITRKLMVSQRYRGTRLGVQLACATFDRSSADGITHNFIDCNRRLYRFFRGLGFREHCGWKTHPDSAKYVSWRYGYSTIKITSIALAAHLPDFPCWRSAHDAV